MTPVCSSQRRFLASLSETQRAIWDLFDNPMGRVGWSLQVWEAPGGAREALQPFMKAGLIRERRLGGYPGAELTDAGRAARLGADHAKGIF